MPIIYAQESELPVILSTGAHCFRSLSNARHHYFPSRPSQQSVIRTVRSNGAIKRISQRLPSPERNEQHQRVSCMDLRTSMNEYLAPIVLTRLTVHQVQLLSTPDQSSDKMALPGPSSSVISTRH